MNSLQSYNITRLAAKELIPRTPVGVGPRNRKTQRTDEFFFAHKTQTDITLARESSAVVVVVRITDLNGRRTQISKEHRGVLKLCLSIRVDHE